VLRAFAIRQLFLAGHAVRRHRRRLAFTNLGHALKADPWVVTRPTFWALAAGCLVPPVYDVFSRLRSPDPRPRAQGVFSRLDPP
jgi:hypothetical protein